MSEWKLVPVDPTEEMIMAGVCAFMDRKDKHKLSLGELTTLEYQAMLEAAPLKEPNDA